MKFYVASTVLVLEKVHQKGMFYSLLNPENVFVDAKGYIRIVDFSTSRFFPRGHKLCFFQGKLEFASPEVAALDRRRFVRLLTTGSARW